MSTKTRTLSRLCCLAGLLLVGLGLPGCAYHFVGSKAEIPGVSPQAETPYRVFIVVADNVTYNSGLEAELPAALARMLTGLSNVRLVSDRSAANLLLAPRVTNLERGRGLGTLQGTQDTADAGGLARGAFTAREFKISAKVDIDMFEVAPRAPDTWNKLWTKTFATEALYDSSLRIIPSKGSSSSSIINQSRERLRLKTLSENIAQMVRDQVFQGF